MLTTADYLGAKQVGHVGLLVVFVILHPSRVQTRDSLVRGMGRRRNIFYFVNWLRLICPLGIASLGRKSSDCTDR